MSSSPGRVPGHWCRLELCISHIECQDLSSACCAITTFGAYIARKAVTMTQRGVVSFEQFLV
jgi:hypothetical protein